MSADTIPLLPLLVALADLAVVFGGIFYLLTHPREPRAMIAWILTFVLLPLLGALLFFLFSEHPRRQRYRRRLERRRRRINPELWQKVRDCHQRFAANPADPELSESVSSFIRIATRINGRRPPTVANRLELFHNRGEEAWERLLQTIATARHHVHLEYFILRDDAYGRQLAELLVGLAARGVRCRLLIDGVGSIGLGGRLPARLRRGGVSVAWYHPLLPGRGGVWYPRLNTRNHRKIAIVDGRYAFVGSQNVAREYFAPEGRRGYWIDTLLLLEGAAVYDLQETFIEDWHYATREDLFADVYFPPLNPPGVGEGRIVQVIPSGPDYDTQVMHHLLLAVISVARETVTIASPYFVPDTAMLLTLEAAALRGVRVSLLVPSRSDHRVALWAGRSYYPQLIAAGVAIHEFVPAFLHSKLVIVDGMWGLVGSANMDVRSFKLNLEITTVLFAAGDPARLQQEVERLMEQANRVDLPRHRPVTQQLLLGLARLVSPLY